MSAIDDIAAERRRQIDVERWHSAHDDRHEKEELTRAAICYIFPMNFYPGFWPWDTEWWKPTDNRRNLVKAAALIAAEIDRIDRSGE